MNEIEELILKIKAFDLCDVDIKELINFKMSIDI